MLGIFIFIVILVVLCVITFRMMENDAEFGVAVMGIVAILWLSLGWFPSIRLAGGLNPDYGRGTRNGYLNKVTVKGVIFKTCEAELQVGSGQMAALQQPWAFSIPMTECNKYTEWSDKNSNKQVTIKFNQWMISPAWVGSSSYVASSMKEVE